MPNHQLKTPQEAASPPDTFSSADEIKILEQRLQLLRDSAKTKEGITAGPGYEEETGQEAAELGVGEAPGSFAPPAPPAPQATQAHDEHFHETKIQELKTYEADKQLKALVEIAFERSVYDAVDIARRLDDAYLLDEFHDTLADDEKLHKRLVETGKLEEV
ncbi:MAG: hypothetical protein Q8Q39_02055 [bacterium]|nr:hypothetical protein [bacterium]